MKLHIQTKEYIVNELIFVTSP